MPLKLYEFVLESIKNHQSDECLLWPFSCCRSGRKGQALYGQIGITTDGKMVNWRVHRLVWTLVHGPIPPGVKIRHTCDVTLCFNERHLISGSQKENIHDAIERGRFLPKGSNHNMAKLDEGKVLEIRFRFSLMTGSALQRYQCLAKEFAVSCTCIQFVIERRNWNHI